MTDLLNTYYGPIAHLETVQYSVSALLLSDLLKPKTMDSLILDLLLKPKNETFVFIPSTQKILMAKSTLKLVLWVF